MRTPRRILIATTLVTLALGTAGCRTPDDYPLVVGGCDNAVVHHAQPGSSTVLDVTASGCRTITDPTGRAAFAIWQLLPSDTRIVRIRTAGPHSPTTQLARTDLERRFGPAPRHSDPSWYEAAPWLLLPVVPIGVGIAGFLITRSAARHGTIIVAIGVRGRSS